MHLGRGCQWLSDLRLAPAGHDTVSRRGGDDGRVLFHHQRVADVAGMHRADVRGLLAVETGVLIRPSR